MDGAKMITDTIGYFLISGRQAYRVGRNIIQRWCGPRGNENPGGSMIKAELETQSLKGQGFLDNDNQSRVS